MSLNILIVEDDDTKTNLLKKEIQNLKIVGLTIYVADCSSNARKYLSERDFDLLLLDLIIPSRVDDCSNYQNGIELLRQILEDNEFVVPRKIIGTTADLSAMKNCEADFRRFTTQIIFVSPEHHDWKFSLSSLITNLLNSKPINNDYDICVISALRSPEQEEFLKLPYNWLPEEHLENGILIRRGEYIVNNKNLKIVSAHCSQMGIVSATFISQMMIQNFRPKILLMNGICGGIGDKIEIGDLVVADKSWDWQSGKYKEGGTFEIAPDQKDASSKLVSLAYSVTSQIVNQYYEDYTGPKPDTKPKIYKGPMISGSAVVEDPNMHEMFKLQHRKAIGVDMECFGLYFISNTILEPKTEVLCIKAVSDLANREKNDHHQNFCSYISSMVLHETIVKYFS